MGSRKKNTAAKRTFYHNPVLWICIGVVLVFGVLYYTQRGTSGPKPYEYNPSTNQYWDPEHKHWHNGPPPLTPSGTAVQTPPTLPTAQTAANTPKPYEYNPTTNQYWDPSHRHWHNGQPPPPESQIVLNAAPMAADTITHKPYEYDPVKNQYWDPNHRHWHNGKPPAGTSIPPANPGGK